MAVKFNMQGMDKLVRKLKRLDKSMRGGIARAATARAAVVGRDSIKRKIHRAAGAYIVRLKNGQQIVRYPGELADALVVKYLSQQERGGKMSVHKITFLKNAQANHGIGKIAHLIEKGVAAHPIPLPNGGSYLHPGHPAYPFMQLGLDAADTRMRAVLAATVRDGLRQTWGQR